MARCRPLSKWAAFFIQPQLLLQGHEAPAAPVQIVYVANRLLPKRATVFMDFIAQVFAAIPAFNFAAGK